MTCRHIPLNFQLCSCVFSTPISDGKDEAQPTLNSPGETAPFTRRSQHSFLQAEHGDLGCKHLRTEAVSFSACYSGSLDLPESGNAAVTCRTDINKPS